MSHEVVVKRFEFVSQRRYFLSDPDVTPKDKNEAEDSPRVIRKGRQVSFAYPGYVALRSNRLLAGNLLILLPYAGLAREFWNENIISEHPTELEFIRGDLAKILGELEKQRKQTANLQLKLGRVLVHNDPNARALTLRGQNILDSRIYRFLFGKDQQEPKSPSTEGETKPRVTFDDTYSRVGYYPVEGRALTIFLDRYGNLRARPGRGGLNAISMIDFMEQLSGLRLLTAVRSCPVIRFQGEEE